MIDCYSFTFSPLPFFLVRSCVSTSTNELLSLFIKYFICLIMWLRFPHFLFLGCQLLWHCGEISCAWAKRSILWSFSPQHHCFPWSLFREAMRIYQRWWLALVSTKPPAEVGNIFWGSTQASTIANHTCQESVDLCSVGLCQHHSQGHC